MRLSITKKKHPIKTNSKKLLKIPAQITQNKHVRASGNIIQRLVNVSPHNEWRRQLLRLLQLTSLFIHGFCFGFFVREKKKIDWEEKTINTLEFLSKKEENKWN